MNGNDGNAEGKEIWFLNRGVLAARPESPFIEWVIDSDPGDRSVDPEIVRNSSTAFLIPEFDYTQDSWDWIEEHCRLIFEMQLNDWYTDRSLWPRDRSWRAFQEWFDLELIDIAWDLIDEPLSSEAPEF